MPNGTDDPGRNGPLADRIERLRDPLTVLARSVPAAERREPRPSASIDPLEWEGWEPWEEHADLTEDPEEPEDPEAPEEPEGATGATGAGQPSDGTGGPPEG